MLPVPMTPTRNGDGAEAGTADDADFADGEFMIVSA